MKKWIILFLLVVCWSYAFSQECADTPSYHVCVSSRSPTPSVVPTMSNSPTSTGKPTPSPTPTSLPTAAPTCVAITSPSAGTFVSGSTVNVKTTDTCGGVWFENLYIDGVGSGSFVVGAAVFDSTKLTNATHTIQITSQSQNPNSVVLGSASIRVMVSNGSPTPSPTPAVITTAPTCHDAASCGTFPLSDTQAASFVNPNLAPVGENESENVARNQSVPTTTQLGALTPMSNLQNAVGIAVMKGVTGNYKGTTNEILQWAAIKWGMDPIAYLAEAYNESGWDMDVVGDMGNGVSLGILQIKSSDYTGTCPGATNVNYPTAIVPCSAFPVLCSSTCLSHQYTAFAADYAIGWMHACQVGGNTYLSNPSFPGYQVSTGVGTAYNDFWSCMGAWFSGKWNDSGSLSYQSLIKGYYSSKPYLNLKQ